MVPVKDLPWWADEERYLHLVRRVPAGQGWSGITVGKGWAPIVLDADAELAELDPDYEIYQVKEKFGGLRFYCSLGSDESSEIIARAEARAARTCEDCGSVRDVSTVLIRGWVRTLCGQCRRD